MCACEVGWRGLRCDRCVPLPGCLHGDCEEHPFQCKCEADPASGVPKWTGAYCDCRGSNNKNNKKIFKNMF